MNGEVTCLWKQFGRRASPLLHCTSDKKKEDATSCFLCHMFELKPWYHSFNICQEYWLSNPLPVISWTKFASSHGISISRSWFSSLKVLNKYIWIFTLYTDCKYLKFKLHHLVGIGKSGHALTEWVWETMLLVQTLVCSLSKSFFYKCSCKQNLHYCFL